MIETEHKSLLLEKLIKINEVIIEETTNNKVLQQTGVLSGISGIVLFLFYYARLKNDNLQAEIALTVLSKGFKQVNKGNLYQTYCSGLSGFGWTINHLNQEGFIEIDDSLLIDTDEYLYKTMQSYLNEGNYDFLHGAIGCGVYFFKRYKSTSSKQLKSQYKTYLLHLIELLEDLSEKDNKGLKWLSVIDIKTGEVHTIMKFDEKTHRTNLGLAHGIISYIIVFCEIYNNYRSEKILSIIRKCVDCLLKFKSDEKKSLSLFPGIAINKNLASYNIPLGWCYGDQTISIGLYKASKILNDQNIKEEAFKLAYRNLNRDSIEKIFPLPMYDAGFCHGLSSIAYIHKKWYSVSKDKKFYSLYESFLSRTLDYGEKEIGIAGYQKYMGNNMHEDAIGLLDGVIGIGVVLIDYLLGENDTKWDQFFLLD